MKKLHGNLLYGQSGGPTAVINASAYGVIQEALKNHDVIEDVICMRYGITGALNEDFIFISKQDKDQVNLLKHTPGSAFGSVRYKLKDYREDDSDYVRLLYIFNKYNIRYFLYNGGNDSMDTCAKISEYMKKVGYECRVVGVPKTIDNDLPLTDHTPGYGSAAKYIANTLMEISYDMLAYRKGKVTIVEIMGRHAGWLTAAAAIATNAGFGPDLIYLPEVPFSIEQFKADVKKVYEQKKQCLVAVSEGIQNEEGVFIGSSSGLKDAFGHFQLGGVASKLVNLLMTDIGVSARSVELASTQRAASHLQSQVDIDEAIEVGRKAVQYALAGETDVMVTIARIDNTPYRVAYASEPLKAVANIEKTLPREWINEAGNGINQGFLDYVLPLIEGEHPPVYQNGVQSFTVWK